ncbi:MAG: calcium/proton exchanger [Bryobacteraceae bacterium]|nr:calcium/proton exchanger [Bryobacteraceae bacterium]MDW8379764.1 calcium/proton exchanger [Bryobacterales bacterium]
MKNLLKPSLNWLLVFVPLAGWLEHSSPGAHAAIFLTACLGIIPLAGWLGHATEHLAARAGEAVGGLLNATFGNAAELIIALIALRKGLYGVVKASLTGSIVGNVLLVLGAACLAGGVKFSVLRFNAAGARSQASLLMLSAIALIMPAAFHYLGGAQALEKEAGLSLEIAIVLLVTYLASLLFTLRTHKSFFQSAAEIEEVDTAHEPWGIKKSLLVLMVSTALVAWMSEVLVGSVEQAAHSFGMTSVFVGVIVVAIVGNAAEHSTAILVAMKNRMDLALGIAIGSSIQIALFVAPLLVIASYFVGPRPMDLVFTPAEVVAVVLSVAVTAQIAGDGESHWLEGVLLLAVYLILGIVFYFLPEASGAKL